jgi:hypothetical protein
VIPDFEPSGLLPAGIHWTNWSEIEKRFGTNRHRKRLLTGLERGAAQLKRANCSALYINGSFVTAKTTPDDYDVCYEMAGIRTALLDRVLLDFSSAGRLVQKAKYYGEFFSAYSPAEGPPFSRVFLNYFQQDSDTGEQKGILGLKLK